MDCTRRATATFSAFLSPFAKFAFSVRLVVAAQYVPNKLAEQANGSVGAEMPFWPRCSSDLGAVLLFDAALLPMLLSFLVVLSMMNAVPDEAPSAGMLKVSGTLYDRPDLISYIE